MPVTPTYPGLYIEELPNTAHTITPAPTSITAFIGYAHPFQGECAANVNWNKASQIFSFADYERIFGGLYRSTVLNSDLADAVYQFFLNGGSNAWVVGLKPKYVDAHQNTTDITGASDNSIPGIVFTSKQLTDAASAVRITIRNTQPGAGGGETADFLITFGPRSEIYRKVLTKSGAGSNNDPTFIANALAQSTLVSVAPSPAGFPDTYGAVSPAQPITIDLGDMHPPSQDTLLPGDFIDALGTNNALDKVDIFNLLVLPGISTPSICNAALAFCEGKRAFYIMDPPPNATSDGMGTNLLTITDYVKSVPYVSPNCALYFPYLKTMDPVSSRTLEQPPSGYVAGVYARTDLTRGVWKAPAGLATALINTLGVVDEGKMNDMQQGTMNPRGINVLRTFDIGTVVWGARTVVTANQAYAQWRYVPVRRTALFIEQTLLRNLGWVVFEPNDEPLWAAIRLSVEAFMLSLFRQQAFQGSSPNDAFRVQCDATTTTQTDINNGIVNIVVGFCPLKPAEFVVIKIAQLAGQVQQ
jgi:hypothetical protein